MSRLQASYVQDYAGFQNAIPECMLDRNPRMHCDKLSAKKNK